jgi:hypothetical protein
MEYSACAGHEPAMPLGARDRLSTATHVELAKDVLQVEFDGLPLIPSSCPMSLFE